MDKVNNSRAMVFLAGLLSRALPQPGSDRVRKATLARKDPNNPYQRERIALAETKRLRQATRRQAQYDLCIRNNPCLAG